MQSENFVQIVQMYTGFVYNVAYRMMGNPSDAEDVVQDTFLSAYRALPSFRGGSSISTWLYRIAANASLMRLRKAKRTPYLTDAGHEEGDVLNWAPTPERESPENVALNSELRGELGNALRLLSPDLRAAVVMRDVQGLSNGEAAETLGISVAALKTRLHRARVLLRNHLAKYVQGGKG